VAIQLKKSRFIGEIQSDNNSKGTSVTLSSGLTRGWSDCLVAARSPLLGLRPVFRNRIKYGCYVPSQGNLCNTARSVVSLER